MPVRYDNGEKYRWTHRCREHMVDWGGMTNGGTRYPMHLMQVADFFVVTDPKRLEQLHGALYKWQKRVKEQIEADKSDKKPPVFSVRPVRGMPDIYICRRVQ